MQNFIYFLKKHRDNLFSWLICIYLYILYIRCIYLSYEDIFQQIDNDYYHYVLNKELWLLNNKALHIDIVIITLLSIIIIASCYLIYKKNRYFYALILFPVFCGLAIAAISFFFNF